MSPDELTCEMGVRVRAERLRQNMSQQTLADRAGVSRATVLRLEAGASTTLGNFVAVLTALHRTGDLEGVLAAPTPMTLEQFSANTQPRRKRASG